MANTVATIPMAARAIDTEVSLANQPIAKLDIMTPPMLYLWRLVTRLRMSSDTRSCIRVPLVVLNEVWVVAKSIISRNAKGRMIA